MRADDDSISQTSFGDSAKPSKAPEKSISDALVDKGAKAPKPLISPVKLRKSRPVGGLLHAGSVSIYEAQGTNFSLQSLPWSFGETIEERNIRTTAIETFAEYNSFWHRKVIEKSSRQNLADVQVVCAAAARKDTKLT